MCQGSICTSTEEGTAAASEGSRWTSITTGTCATEGTEEGTTTAAKEGTTAASEGSRWTSAKGTSIVYLI